MWRTTGDLQVITRGAGGFEVSPIGMADSDDMAVVVGDAEGDLVAVDFEGG
jgi:hypothetical protein